jgi:hypothetical protein
VPDLRPDELLRQEPNRHATAHSRKTGHPMIRSGRPGEDWRWCYLDDRFYFAGPTGYEAAEE